MTAPATKFRDDRPSKAVIRNLVKIGALPPLPPRRSHPTRDIVDAAYRVANGLADLRGEQSKAGLAPRNFSSGEAWARWCVLHRHSLIARQASASRQASREARRAQGDFFITAEGRAV